MAPNRTIRIALLAGAAVLVSGTTFAWAGGLVGTQRDEHIGKFQPFDSRLVPPTAEGNPTRSNDAPAGAHVTPTTATTGVHLPTGPHATTANPTSPATAATNDGALAGSQTPTGGHTTTEPPESDDPHRTPGTWHSTSTTTAGSTHHHRDSDDDSGSDDTHNDDTGPSDN